MSFGLASSDQAADFDQVVALADEALLRAKSGGRNEIVIADPDKSVTLPITPTIQLAAS